MQNGIGLNWLPLSLSNQKNCLTLADIGKYWFLIAIDYKTFWDATIEIDD